MHHAQTSTVITDRKRNSKRWHNIKTGLQRYWFLYVLLIPILAYYVIYRYYPMLLQAVLAFKNYRINDGVWGSPWVGLDNIRKLFSHRDFPVIFKNTVTISLLRLAVGFFPPIILAILLFDVSNMVFKKVTQTILYIPHFFSWVIIYSIVYSLFSNQGLVNGIIQSFGGEPVSFLLSSKWFRPLLIGSGLWKELGWGTIIYMAALGNIDTQLFEAAKIDGAGPLKRIWHITLPGIMDVVVFLLILNLGNVLKNAGAEQILLFYSPATYHVGDVIDTWVYRQGIGQLQYSLSASVAFFQALFGLILVLIANKVSQKITGIGIW